MPYIITTRTARGPVGPIDRLSRREQEQALDWQRGMDETHQAVATLEEAQDEADLTVRYHLDESTPLLWDTSPERASALCNAAQGLPESGGTIGPLPDGTVIEVEPCDRFWMLTEMGRAEDSSDTVPEIIDAYNARHAPVRP